MNHMFTTSEMVAVNLSMTLRFKFQSLPGTEWF